MADWAQPGGGGAQPGGGGAQPGGGGAQPGGGGLDMATGDVSEVEVSQVDVSAIDATAVDPVVFANMVRTASDEQLGEALALARETILDEVFRRMEEHFDPEKAPTASLIMHWRLTGRDDGGHDLYQVVVAGGGCTVQRGAVDQPLVTFELSAPDFLRIATGNLHGAALYLSGGLKIDGDVAQALAVQTWFRIPEPTLPASPAA